MTSTSKKLKVGVIGTGNIGADLLIKIIKSKYLECTLFTGRNLNSPGIKRAISLGVAVSDQGIDAIINNPAICDIVIDCTSAQSHQEHWPILNGLKKIVIDMTPAKIGKLCIPAINSTECIDENSQNINMITCGGQVSIPIANAISKVHQNIEYIEVASSIASRSAGPATRYNLDEYVETTEAALIKFTGAKRTKAILILNPANPPIEMQTTIYAKILEPNIDEINKSVFEMVKKINQYVPGYQIIVPPTVEGNKVTTTIKVLGAGDYLPQYAGNLDIINCAAIAMAEQLAKPYFLDKRLT